MAMRRKRVRRTDLVVSGAVGVVLVLGMSLVSTARAVAVSPGPSVGRYIVALRPGVDSDAVASEHRARFGESVERVYHFAFRGYAAVIPTVRLDDVRADPRVAYVTPDLPVEATAARPVGSTQVVPTGIDRIDADQSSTLAGDGQGTVAVNVAVLDTGIDPTHPDLNVVGGTNCQNGTSYADQNDHGTHVAGTIGALDNTIGVVGVAPGARLWAVRVLNQKGGGNKSTLLCGIDWVLGTRLDADPTNDIAVANMSLSGSGSTDGNCGNTKMDPIHQAICAATSAGVLFVAAAGNSGHDLAGAFPAAYDEVLAVTAITDLDGMSGGLVGTTTTSCISGTSLTDDTAVFFSNFATTPAAQEHTIAAPGVCILSSVRVGSTVTPGGYDSISGTSQAAPHVAGVAALCIASGSCAGLSPAQIIQKLRGDALAYLTSHPKYGFVGDPAHPIAGKYYGPLARAALY
jgi:subtilisin